MEYAFGTRKAYNYRRYFLFACADGWMPTPPAVPQHDSSGLHCLSSADKLIVKQLTNHTTGEKALLR